MCIRRFLFVSLFVLFAFAVTAQEADLAVEKLGPSSAASGNDVSYTITVTNAGPAAASSVTLTDAIPTGMSYVSATQNTGPAFTCDATVTCTIAALAADESATFTFVFHIDQPGDFTNIATVSSQTFDPNSENDTSAAFTTTASGTYPTCAIAVKSFSAS